MVSRQAPRFVATLLTDPTSQILCNVRCDAQALRQSFIRI